MVEQDIQQIQSEEGDFPWFLDDSDGNGLSNIEESIQSLSSTFPQISKSMLSDRDGDGLSLIEEIFAGTKPGEADSDGDGIYDYTDYLLENLSPRWATFGTSSEEEINAAKPFENTGDATFEGNLSTEAIQNIADVLQRINDDLPSSAGKLSKDEILVKLFEGNALNGFIQNNAFFDKEVHVSLNSPEIDKTLAHEIFHLFSTGDGELNPVSYELDNGKRYLFTSGNSLFYAEVDEAYGTGEPYQVRFYRNNALNEMGAILFSERLVGEGRVNIDSLENDDYQRPTLDFFNDLNSLLSERYQVTLDMQEFADLVIETDTNDDFFQNWFESVEAVLTQKGINLNEAQSQKLSFELLDMLDIGAYQTSISVFESYTGNPIDLGDKLKELIEEMIIKNKS